MCLANNYNISLKFFLEETSLFYAVRGGHTEIVKSLLNHGADVNVKGKDGKILVIEPFTHLYIELITKLS